MGTARLMVILLQLSCYAGYADGWHRNEPTLCRLGVARWEPCLVPRCYLVSGYATVDHSRQKGFGSRVVPLLMAANASGKTKISAPGPSASPVRGIFTAAFPFCGEPSNSFL